MAAASDGTWHIIPSSNPGFPITQQWGFPADVPVPGDYDGDGKTDYAVYHPSNSIWYVLGSAAGYSETQWGQFGDVPAPGDYDGDGRAEPAVFRPSDTVWYIRPTSAVPYQWQWGTPGDVPVAPLYYGYLAPVPTVQLVNLSHPGLTPNFAVGDTFQVFPFMARQTRQSTWRRRQMPQP